MVRWLIVGLAGAAIMTGWSSAQERGIPSELPSNTEHLEILSKRVARLSMTLTNGNKQAAPHLLEPPVMRSSNKGENHDGAVWLWLDGERPVAVVSVWNRGLVWYSENTALTDEPLEVSGWPGATWRPRGAAKQWLTQEEPVGDSPVVRQRTLREIARKFAAREDREGIKSELRLLPRPLYSFTDLDHDVLEGALFAFVLGTDPELFMQIEAHTIGGAPRWQVAFARMASAELGVQMGESHIWTAPAIPKDGKPRFDTGYCMVREPPVK